jgi:hypothetical protein
LGRAGVVSLISEIQRYEIELDASTLTSILRALAEFDDLETALQIFSYALPTIDKSSSKVAITFLVSMVAKSRDPKMAGSFIDRLRLSGFPLPPDAMRAIEDSS